MRHNSASSARLRTGMSGALFLKIGFLMVRESLRSKLAYAVC
jgi:hypothetical protein